ncbi:ABC-2 type transport system ATP-binding protein [Candidatus Hakubella thermalkaliphila]|uniref:ABC-2 type transport system ATP-binding protein n=1 Tax=Candidatus Hakubella thermalkaliphila TaxID=2754717 RepID=A0A6V8PZY2_9ACTN|nr:ABC transporter ATP-binding protein [Candidatus Hakubella thermalkaliphila]GFP18873.1 ABC-2 type transport system ATP-binding protein [Candidatus Hakubella thermalkaliphila]GFP31147.1 ABC-2 type transport system ATP-binding protein [Candidatus Hakubella thermalkaliphila]GFP36646.1 ABC-2 type transport system ATP-binding protein [Candidatus Hakubella thermalkaliphila]
MVAIETSKLTRKFGNLVAVEDLTIEVMRGEVLGFLGPNGAGKTTTVRMLAGIIAPTSGHAVVAGIRTDHEIQRLHEVIGLLTETPGFYERLSARRNLQFFARFYSNIDADGQVDKYLKIMGLWGRRNEKVGSFSKGMKQRLALARALLHERPDLVQSIVASGGRVQSVFEKRHSLEEIYMTLLCEEEEMAAGESR